MTMPRIIAAHAGTGKTILAINYPDNFVDFVCMPYKYYLPDEEPVEREASKADWSLDMREDWPENYVRAIAQELTQHDKFLLIPPAMNVLSSLAKMGIKYFLVYPRRDAKDEYHERYINRGNNEEFMCIFVDGWDRFINSFETDVHGVHIILEHGKYLSDALSYVTERIV